MALPTDLRLRRYGGAPARPICAAQGGVVGLFSGPAAELVTLGYSRIKSSRTFPFMKACVAEKMEGVCFNSAITLTKDVYFRLLITVWTAKDGRNVIA